MQIVSNIALISINETLIIQLISFLIFLFIINRIMLRPLQSTMDKRDKHVEKIRLDIVDSENELETMTKEIKERESKTKEEAFKLKKEREKAGSLQAAEIFASTQKEIEAIRKKAETEVNTQISEAARHIKRESEALATTIIEKILDRRLVQ